MLYKNLAYALIAIFLLYKLIKNDYDLFHALMFVLPIHSWYYNIGLNLSVFQIVVLCMLFVALFSSINRNKILSNLGNEYIAFFFLYAIINTLIISIFFTDEFLQIGGFFRSEGRFLAQLILLSITFSVIPLAFYYIRNFKDVYRCIEVYLYALILLVALGWMQYLVYVFSGTDLFPLSINQYGDLRTGIFGYGEMSIFRMSSLAGEPKSFSISLVFGFFVIHVFNRYGVKFFKYDKLLKYLFLFTAFATLSTSGMVLFVVLFVVYTLLQIIRSTSTINLDFKKSLYLLTIVFVISALLFKNWDFTSLIVQQRIFERNLVSEDFDAPIQMFLSKNPVYLLFGSGLGNIHNLAYPFILHESLFYMEGNVFFAKSGYLRIISELGLIGFSLFLYMVYSVYRKLGSIGKHLMYDNKNIVNTMQILLIIILMAYLARIYVINEFISFLAIANVIAYSKRIMPGVIAEGEV